MRYDGQISRYPALKCLQSVRIWIHPTRELVGVLVLQERHLWGTFGAALGRQIEHEVVLHELEQCRAEHRICVIDLTVCVSLEDRNTRQVFRSCFATWPWLDVIVHVFCTCQSAAFGDANVLREGVATCRVDVPNPVVGFDGWNECFIFALGDDGEGHQAACLNV